MHPFCSNNFQPLTFDLRLVTLMNRDIRWYDYLTVNIYYLGLTVLTQTMAPLVLPLLVQKFVGTEQQGRYFGAARLGGLMVALLCQALMGMLSDRSMLRWGKRRPFIVMGTLVSILSLVGIGLSANFEGTRGFYFLFAMYVLQQLATNTAQSAEQSLIPDLVPEDKHGVFSGIKALFEVPVPMVVVALIIAPLIHNSHLWGALALVMGTLFVTMLITLGVPETAPHDTPPVWDWPVLLQLLLMTGAFTAISLAMGEVIKLTGRLMQNTASPLLQVLVMGGVGFGTMTLAIVAGVSGCFRISVGKRARQNASAFVWWVISRLAFLTGVTNLAGFILYFLQTRLGFNEQHAVAPASRMMIFIGVFVLAATVPAGWLTDKWGHKRIVALSGIVAALGTVITLLATHIGFVYVGGAAIGVATGMFYTASWALGTHLVPASEAGRYLGLSNLAGAGAGAVGAYIGGPVADFFTTHVPDIAGLGYMLIFAIYGMLFILSVVALKNVET